MESVLPQVLSVQDPSLHVGVLASRTQTVLTEVSAASMVAPTFVSMTQLNLLLDQRHLQLNQPQGRNHPDQVGFIMQVRGVMRNEKCTAIK